MLRDEARVWSIKFPAAPQSTSAVETVHEGLPASVSDTKKGLSEKDEILTPAPEGGRSRGRSSALVDTKLGHTGHC